jgi:hypothetical protein
MHAVVKKWVRTKLAELWVKEFSGRIDMEDNWIADTGRVVKWEIRDAKAHESWQFSITLGMTLGSIFKEAPDKWARFISEKLSEEAPVGWTFEPTNGFVNAYFKPYCLKDYLGSGFKLEVDIASNIAERDYAIYRLRIIQKSLIARGVQPSLLEEPIETVCLDRFAELFLPPETKEESQLWCKRVHHLTTEGKLIGLEVSSQSTLLAFLNEI